MGNLYLIGFMGAGKSTVARELGRVMGVPVVEMDKRIEAEQGMPITDIFEKYGEEHFRDLETELLKTLAGEGSCVVSCGGGSVLRDENAAIMKGSGRIVLLEASPETIYERVKDSKDRPILNGHMNVEYISGLMEKRRGRYESVADVRVSTDSKRVSQIAREIRRSV